MFDLYCERAGSADVWAEPLNALTNLAFLVAAVAVGWRLRRTPELSWHNAWDLWVLTGLLGAIGFGSGLWHTLATSWGLLADVLPITLFINLYLLAFGWRVLGLRWLGDPLPVAPAERRAAVPAGGWTEASGSRCLRGTIRTRPLSSIPDPS